MKKLQRTLSLPGAIAVSVGGMRGIFVPGLAVGITGSLFGLLFWLLLLYSACCSF